MKFIKLGELIYRAVPNFRSVKDKRGHWSEVPDGWRGVGVPMLKVYEWGAGSNRDADLKLHVLAKLDMVEPDAPHDAAPST